MKGAQFKIKYVILRTNITICKLFYIQKDESILQTSRINQ